MRKIVVVALAMFSYVSSMHCQMEYKQNFLLAFNKQPDIKTCEAAYNFMICKDSACAAFKAMKDALAKASEELTNLQTATGNAAISPAAPTMSPEDAQKLSEKLESMTEEEKQQWAMENAKNYSPSANVHANKDRNNKVVSEAVKCVTDQQANYLQEGAFMLDFTPQLKAIEEKYKSKKDEALKKFQTASGTTYDPSSSYPYVTGEMSSEEDVRFNKAIEEYKRTVVPIYNSEMKEKLDSVLHAEQRIVPIYNPIEEKIASTHYADDAQEPVNKMQLFTGHSSILRKVQRNIEVYGEILSNYADWYAALMKIKSVKEDNNK